MSRPRSIAALTTALVVAAAGAAAGAQASGPGGMEQGPRPPERPTKVVIIVVDSLSREIVDKYDMRNVQTLMRDGVDTPRGYLGHTGSVTVVTHNVITSGQLPKHMGWTDEGYRDVDGVLPRPRAGQPRPALHHEQLRPTQMFTLQQARATPSSTTTSSARTRRPRRSRSAPRATPRTRSAAPRPDSIITFSSATCAGVAGLLAQAGRHQRAVVHPRRSRAAGSGCTAATRPTPTTRPSCPPSSTRSTATAT